jgi:hypothetical protein
MHARFARLARNRTKEPDYRTAGYVGIRNSPTLSSKRCHTGMIEPQSYGQWLPYVRHTIYSVQKILEKLVKKYAKMLLTQAFSRHIIGVVPEQKKYTGAKKEQKQKFEQKTPQKRPFLAGGRFICALGVPIKIPDRS